MARSLVKPYLQQFSGSGTNLEHLIIERCLESAHMEYGLNFKPTAYHLIVVPTVEQTFLSWTRDGTGARVRSDFTTGDLILNPSGCFVRPQWDRDTRFTLVAIKPSSITEICGELEVPIVDMPKLFNFKDRRISRSVQRLIVCFETINPQLLEAQALERMLIQQVVGKCLKINDRNHRLSKVKLARVHDFIHERLADTITLEEMARVAEYSPSRFLVLFGNTTGFSPHQYVIQQRLERARELISGTVLPFSAIAADCGFSDQSHLIRHFKRHTGLTPSQARKK